MAYLDDHPPARRQFRKPRRERPSGVHVIHTAENTPDNVGGDSGAEGVASFIQRRSDPGSYHLLCDSDTTIYLIDLAAEAFHDATGSNPHSIGISGATQAAKWKQMPEARAQAMVKRMAAAAAFSARWVENRYGIIVPARRISRAESERRKPGFISHAERDPDRRTDPGQLFDWDLFLGTYESLMGGEEVDDLPSVQEVWDYENKAVEKGDVYGLLVEAYRRSGAALGKADYATKQLNSVAGGVSELARSLRDQGVITTEQLNKVNQELAGSGEPGLSY